MKQGAAKPPPIVNRVRAARRREKLALAKATEQSRRFNKFMKNVIGPAQPITLAQYLALDFIPCPEVWDRYVETGRTTDGYPFELAMDCFVGEYTTFRVTATYANAGEALIICCVDRLTDGRWVAYDGTREHARVAYSAYGRDLLPITIDGQVIDKFSPVQTMGPGLPTFSDIGKSNHGKHDYLGWSELDPPPF